MKVLYISYNGILEPLMQSQGISYMKGLSRKGIKYFLLTFEKYEKKRRYMWRKVDRLKRELENYNIEWFPLKYHKSPSLFATLFDISIGILVGIYLCIFKKIDIIHTRGTIPASMGYVISRVLHKKFIFDVRGLMPEEYVDGFIWKRESFIYTLARQLEKNFLKNADALVVLTKNIKDFLFGTDSLVRKDRNITVIPCCVDIKKFNNKKSLSTKELKHKYKLLEKFVFLYIGSVGTWYLLDKMVDFFIVAKRIINNAHFLILTHSDRRIIKNCWAKTGFSFNDITLEEVAFNDMPDYIKLGNVGIFFIRPVFSKRASSPIKFAEYLACGLPVIINSGIGDTEEIVTHNRVGIVIEDFNDRKYLEGVRDFLNLAEEGTILKERCYKVAKRYFSLEQGVEKYYAIYKEVVL